MDQNILIKFSADTGGIDETNRKLDELSKREKELVNQIKELDKDKNVRKYYAQTAQEQAEAEQKYGKQIEKTRKELKGTRNDIEALSKAQKDLTATISDKTAEKSFRTLRREIEENIKAIRLRGEVGTEEYQRLIKQAGDLADIEADVRREIKGLASDTRGFDTLLEGTQLVAGGFSALQGIMSLAGIENSDYQKTLVKLNSLIAITTGLQQVQNAVQKESSLMIAIGNLQRNLAVKATNLDTAAKSKNIGVSKAATAAQWALNAAASANPYVLLATAVVSVVGALYLFASRSSDAEKAEESHKKAVDSLTKSIEANDRALDRRNATLKAMGASELAVINSTYQNAIKNYNAAVAALSSYQEEVRKGRIKLNEEHKQQLIDIQNQQARILNDATLDYNNYFIALETRLRNHGKTDIELRTERYKKERKLVSHNDDLLKKLEDEYLNDIAEIRRKNNEKADKKTKEAYDRLVKDLNNYNKTELELLKEKYDSEYKLLGNNTEAQKILTQKYNKERKEIIQKNEDEIEKINKEAQERRNRQFKEDIDYSTALSRQELNAERLKNEQILVSANSSYEERQAARQKLANYELDAIEIEKQANQLKYDAGVISEKEYQLTLTDLTQEGEERRLEIEREFAERRKELTQSLIDAAKQTFSEFISYLGESQTAAIDKQLKELDKLYTTDKEKAKENSNLKLISEKEYAAKQKELEDERSRVEKKNKRAQIYANAAEATAKVYMEAAKLKAQAATYQAIPVVGPALSAAALALLPIIYAQIPFIAAQTALQVATVNKYWKGRKSGQGEYAMVGEAGPELMYIPQGASIVPAYQTKQALNGNTDVLRGWNIPQPELPKIPNFEIPRITSKYLDFSPPYIEEKVIEKHINHTQYIKGEKIDYEKIGKTVAKYQKVPVIKQRGDVHVSVNNDGTTVEENGSRRNGKGTKKTIIDD